MRHFKHHRELTDGVGKCGVPMWTGGCPAGFCEKPAYGKQEPGQQRYGEWRMGKFDAGYSMGLACYHHGGPENPAPATFIDIVFDGPTGPEGGRFVEVEDSTGKSIRLGEWIERDDGYHVLRFDPKTIGGTS